MLTDVTSIKLEIPETESEVNVTTEEKPYRFIKLVDESTKNAIFKIENENLEIYSTSASGTRIESVYSIRITRVIANGKKYNVTSVIY